jgi:hypothetical protein
MTLSDLMRALDDHGVTLSLLGDGVKVRAPAPLPEGLMEAVRTHKAAIIAALGEQASEAHDSLLPVHDARDPHAMPTAPCAACGGVAEVSAEEVASLPPVHDADDPWKKPSVPCAACGAAHWRVWCHDQRKVWQWICNRCRPLVVVHKDGTRWRA